MRVYVGGIAATVLLLCLGCGSTSSTTTAGPSPDKCQVAATNTTPTFTAGGGTGAITVQAARECSWSASTTTAWIALSATQGQGEGSLKYAVQPNPAGVPRQGSVSVSGHAVEVAQAAAACSFALAPTSLDAPAAQSASEFSLQAPAGCAWTASSQADWLTIVDTQGAGAGRVRIQVGANTGPARTGTFTAGGVRVEVRQAGSGSPPPPGTPAPAPPPPQPPAPEPPAPEPPAPSDCSFSFLPESASIGAAGGDGEMRLVTSAECSWTIASDAPWLSLQSAAEGRGEARVRYRAAPNPDTGARSGRLVVASSAFVLEQAGQSPPPPDCSFDVGPLEQSFGALGGGGSVTVKTGKDCAWTAESHESWISITSGGSQTGGGDVQFQVATNTGGERSGTLTVAGQTVTIQQAALVSNPAVTVQGDIAALDGECPAVTFSLGSDVVQTTIATVFAHGSCGKLKNGISVRVRGLRDPAGSTITALELEFTNLDQIAQ